MREIKWIFFFLLISTLSYAQVESEIDTLRIDMKQDNVSSGVVLISESELSSDEESADISGILQSSRDVFVSTAAYTFGSARFRIRGYDSDNSMVSMNGVNLNDMESGRVYWSSWGGLNDALRNSEILNGITAAQFSYGGIGGATNMEVRASSYSPTTKFTYSHANRSYNNRIMLTYATGLMENGWAFTFSGSRRWAQEGYVKGTSYDAFSYFLAIEKKFNDQHSLGFVGYGTPNKRGGATAVVQEAYDLAGSNYYNPYWGFQNGEIRNSRVSNYHKPMMMLTHYWTPDEATKLTTSASYMFGRGGSSALNWYTGNDPRPDYYKNLPSYYEDSDPEYADWLTNQWQTNESYRQLDWDYFYHANEDEFAQIENANGIEGNTVYGKRSNYIIEDRRSDSKKMNLTSTFNKRLNDHTTLSAGIDLTNYKGERYTQVADLLGGDFYLDVNKFAERDFVDPNVAQSDLNNPNRVVKVGDVFGYDYTVNVNKYMAWAQAAFEYSKVDYFVGANASFDQFWRTGHMRNGLFPEDSYGDSDKNNFTNYGAKAGVTYKVTGRHYLSANAMYQTKSPSFRDSYLSDRTRDQVVDDLTNQKIASADVNYVIRYPKFNARVSGYYAKFADMTWSRSFYHEDLQNFVNYNMTGMDQRNMGLEFGAEAEVITGFKIKLVAAYGEYIYDSRPSATITLDNSREVLSNRTAYIENYYVGGMPQTAASLGFNYRAPFFMFFGIDFNYFDRAYLPINPDRRTAEAVAGITPEYPTWDLILDQERLPSAFTIDASIGKSWRIDYKYYIGLNLSANNILNNTSIVTGGYEQYRYDTENIDKFANKYYYMYGTTFFLNVSFRF
jgi:hypothetical protein